MKFLLSFPLCGDPSKLLAAQPLKVAFASCYTTEKAQIPKSESAAESAGKSAGKRHCWGGSAGRPLSLEKQRNGTALGTPPSSALAPGTLPSTFGDLGFLSPVAGGLDSKLKKKAF